MWSLSEIKNLINICKIPFRSCSAICYQNFKQTCTDMRCLNRDVVRAFFQHLECIISDADGVLWLNEKPIEGSVETFNWLQDQGKHCFIVTNNSTKTRKKVHEKACSMGLEVNEKQIVNATHYTAKYLKDLKFNKKAYVIGKEGLSWELSSMGIKHINSEDDSMIAFNDLRDFLQLEKDVGAVIVGFDEFFNYPKLTKACSYLVDPQCLFIAINTDEQVPTPSLIMPGGGCMVRAIETCAKRSATVMGKPNAQIVKTLITKGSIKPAKTLMIGDRGSTDMLFGHNCGFYTLLVFTGTDTLLDIKQWQVAKNCKLRNQVPDFYLPRLSSFQEILCS